MVIFGHLAVTELCMKLHQNWMIFLEIWRFNDLQYGGYPLSCIFKIWSLSCDLCRNAVLLHCVKFN